MELKRWEPRPASGRGDQANGAEKLAQKRRGT